ncbi:MAG: 6-carboxytetrahydropterin synthase QueD [Acidobacteriota bacterium]|nr:6-carboxytetrahydropterin synthase QueD [Acidobacteriota bacterium]
MFTVFKDFTFAAGHFIRGHTGGCQNLHGHNYRIRVFLNAEELDELGMVLDFSHLKAMVQEVVGHYDHQVINDHPPFDQLNPTAELLSQHVYREVSRRLDDPRVSVGRVEVWENDSSCASYEEAK